jgi:hypothetical protein
LRKKLRTLLVNPPSVVNNCQDAGENGAEGPGQGSPGRKGAKKELGLDRKVFEQRLTQLREELSAEQAERAAKKRAGFLSRLRLVSS